MRLGILLLLSRDRRSASRVLGEVRPVNEVVTSAKALITKNECPDPRFPVLQAVSLDNIQREHVFHLTPAQEAAAKEISDVRAGDELNAVIAANEAMAQQAETDAATIKDLETRLTEQAGVYESVIAEKCQEIGRMQTAANAQAAKLEEAEAANARAVAALGEAQEAAKISAARIQELTAKLADAEAKAAKPKK